MRKHELKALVKHNRRRVRELEASICDMELDHATQRNRLREEIEELRKNYHWLNCELVKAKDKLRLATGINVDLDVEGIIAAHQMPPSPEAQEAREKAVWLDHPDTTRFQVGDMEYVIEARGGQ